MNVLGQAVRLSSEGTIIVRAQSAPPIGTVVCDNRGKDLGKIVRVTGPVSAPYVIVRPSGGMPEGVNRLIGREVYISRPPERRERPRFEGRERMDRRQERRPYSGSRDGSGGRGGPRRHDDRRRGSGRV